MSKKIKLIFVFFNIFILFGCNVLKNNYITFDKIDTSGVSIEVKESAKELWDKMDEMIDLLKKNETNFEGSQMIIELMRMESEFFNVANNSYQKSENLADLTFVSLFREHLKRKLLKNNLHNCIKALGLD